jgi:hypothetical protein
MKKFSEFIEKRKYVAVVYNQNTHALLEEWCYRNGFDTSISWGGENSEKPFKFHTTMIYSTNKMRLRNQEFQVPPSRVTPLGIEWFGRENDVPVLLITSPEIERMRKVYLDMGLKDDAWGGVYKPHISLSYAKNKFDTTNVELPDFGIITGKIIVEDINE